ncbi:hypothetical protein ACFQU1_12350 [Chelatococcus sp. GCM10030263]|jgi:hypothetical protein
MAKGQQRGNREAKKPKKPKKEPVAEVTFAKGSPASIGVPKKKS